MCEYINCVSNRSNAWESRHLRESWQPLCRGVCRISQGGGGPTLKFMGFWIYMPRSGMSRAAKLRAFVRGVWGHAPPPRKFLKMVQFCAFWGLFSTTFMVKKSSPKIINKHKFFHWPFYNAAPPLIYLNIDVMDT